MPTSNRVPTSWMCMMPNNCYGRAYHTLLMAFLAISHVYFPITIPISPQNFCFYSWNVFKGCLSGRFEKERKSHYRQQLKTEPSRRALLETETSFRRDTIHAPGGKMGSWLLAPVRGVCFCQASSASLFQLSYLTLVVT